MPVIRRKISWWNLHCEISSIHIRPSALTLKEVWSILCAHSVLLSDPQIPFAISVFWNPSGRPSGARWAWGAESCGHSQVLWATNDKFPRAFVNRTYEWGWVCIRSDKLQHWFYFNFVPFVLDWSETPRGYATEHLQSPAVSSYCPVLHPSEPDKSIYQIAWHHFGYAWLLQMTPPLALVTPAARAPTTTRATTAWPTSQVTMPIHTAQPAAPSVPAPIAKFRCAITSLISDQRRFPPRSTKQPNQLLIQPLLPVKYCAVFLDKILFGAFRPQSSESQRIS